jgi:hypothetical protein
MPRSRCPQAPGQHRLRLAAGLPRSDIELRRDFRSADVTGHCDGLLGRRQQAACPSASDVWLMNDEQGFPARYNFVCVIDRNRIVQAELVQPERLSASQIRFAVEISATCFLAPCLQQGVVRPQRRGPVTQKTGVGHLSGWRTMLTVA